MSIHEDLNYWSDGPPMRFDELTYDEKRKFRYDLQDYMQAFFQFEKFRGKKILEIGCGSGIDSCEFARNGADVTSIDFTEIATKLTKNLICSYNGDVARCSASILPFREGNFDVVYSFGVIHHVRDAQKLVSEIARVLKHSGLFMGMVYNKDSLLYAYLLYYYGVKNNQIKKMTEDQIISKYSERREECPYTKAYTKNELEELLADNGFVILEVDSYYNVLDIPDYKRKIKFSLGDKKLSLGWHLAFKAKKS